MKGTFLVAATALALSACTWTVDMRSDQRETESGAPDPFFVEGRLFYPERIALPGNAELRVAVDAVGAEGRTSLTRFSTDLAGRQVPLPLGFSVQPERDRRVLYELSAAVLADGRLLRLTGPVLVLPEDGRADLGEVRLLPPLEAGFGQAWRCQGTEVMVGTVDEHLFVAVDGQLHAVERVSADSGIRYQASHEETIGIQEENGELELLRGGDAVADCDRLEALSPPLSGRGIEPGWHIEIGEDRIELVSDYGQTETEAELIQRGSSGRTTRFRGLGRHGPILAAFERRTCPNPATGMPHPYALRVQFEGGELRGCAGQPRDLLLSREWVVTAVDGEAIAHADRGAEDERITLRFDVEGRVSGRAVCNRYFADYTLSPERLDIERPAATLMACPDADMQLERRFLELLAATRRFEIDPDGRLILITDEGRIAARAE